jgi:hypothetical protein
MITEADIEALGNQLADLWAADNDENSTSAESFALIEHLEGDDLDDVLTRAQDISLVRNAPELIDSTESLMRLAHATGCPDDEAVIPWLQERGLIEEVDGGGFRFKATKPGVVT